MKTERFEVFGGTMVIHLGEDLDHHNAVYIREMADGYVEKYPIDRIIFDFSGVEFMDSSGIGVVFGRYKKITAMGGSVVIRNAGRLVKQILAMSGVFSLMEYEETADCDEAGARRK